MTWAACFALLPVRTLGGRRVWLRRVERRWNPETNFRILAPWDPGDYCGSWEFRLPLVPTKEAAMAFVFNEQGSGSSRIQPSGDTTRLAAQRMETYGGDFDRLIGAAYSLADGTNRRALVEAFRPLFEHYAKSDWSPAMTNHHLKINGRSYCNTHLGVEADLAVSGAARRLRPVVGCYCEHHSRESAQRFADLLWNIAGIKADVVAGPCDQRGMDD